MKTTQLRIYGKCNFRCRICMANDFNKSSFARFESLKEQILQAEKDGIEELDIGGGEPTVLPDFDRVLEYTYQQGMKCSICTNGFRFAERSYAKKFRKFRPIGLKISFHSHREKVFDYITRIPGSYKGILRAIKNIQEELKVYPESKDSYLLANIVITSLNYKDLPNMVDFLYSRNVRFIKIIQLGLSGKVYNHPELLVGLDKIEPYLKEAVFLAKKLKMLYYLGTLPICILGSEAKYFIPLVDTANYVKFIFCRSCRHDRRCPGVGKSSLIARYGRQLLESRGLFPGASFEHIFKEKDLEFIRKFPLATS